MHDREALDMMRRCLSDIEDLRRQREALVPKAEAYEVLRAVVGLLPKQSGIFSEDISWTLRKKIKELEEASKNAS